MITLKEIKIKDINEQHQSQQRFEYVSDRKTNGEERNWESWNINACKNVTNKKKSVHAAETQNMGYQESRKALWELVEHVIIKQLDIRSPSSLRVASNHVGERNSFVGEIQLKNLDLGTNRNRRAGR